MRIVSFGDIHDSDEAFSSLISIVQKTRPQLLIGVGDIINYKRLCEALLGIGFDFKFLCVHGNNDNLEDIKARESDFSFMVHLDRKKIEFEGLKIGGVGGVIGSKERNVTEKDLKKALEEFGQLDILITHLDPESKGGGIIVEYVKTHKPKIWFHGHSHKGAGEIKRIGQTLVINSCKPVVSDIGD